MKVFTALVCAVALAALVRAGADDAPIASAARNRDVETVRALLKKGGDVNAATGDGMTPLHWAALNGDADLVKMLLYAGANARATTRLGGYTPLHLATKEGFADVTAALLDAGADLAAVTATGATPLMLAAASGSTDTVTLLLDKGAPIDAKDRVNEETALMFAAALDRTDVVTLLIARGADVRATAKVVDYTSLVPPGDEATMEQARREAAARAGAAAGKSAPGANARAAAPLAPKAPDVAGMTRPFTYSELVGREGGLTALHLAARQGAMRTVEALVARGADVNQASAADGTTPLLIATINGQLDIAQYLLDHGADPNAASAAGATPLYAAINVEWAPKSFYPQPRAQYEQHRSYLDLVQALLDKGADPNVRLKKALWYTQYNFDLLRVDEIGATPFWRAAYAADIDAMKLLVKYGADPHIPTMKPATRRQFQGGTRGGDTSSDHSGLPPVPVGGPGVPPLLAATGEGYGEGFAANAHRFAPTGLLAGVRYLVEELHADVNARDADGNTPLHNAASRGDNEMIKYLVSKGADVMAVNRAGQTTVDMANGPVQRTQPFPETIELLESLGAKNNHHCVSC